MRAPVTLLLALALLAASAGPGEGARSPRKPAVSKARVGKAPSRSRVRVPRRGLAARPVIEAARPALARKPAGRIEVAVHAHPSQDGWFDAFMSAPDETPLGKLAMKGGALTGEMPRASKFSLSVTWYVEGFGHLWLEADNGGRLYRPGQATGLQLNYELARSRVRRNQRVLRRYRKGGLAVPDEVRRRQEEAASLFAEAGDARSDSERAALSDRSLALALRAGEELELAWARHQQSRPGWQRPRLGADSRHYWVGPWQEIDKHIFQLLDIATITHYDADTWAPHFQPSEGKLRWGLLEDIYDWLAGRRVEVVARPIFWPHDSVTPAFLRAKSFPELKTYVVEHATRMVEHWGPRVTHWEIANEMHDWANVHDLDPQQTTELIKLIAKTVRRLQPGAVLVVNNTYVFGEYAGLDQTAQGPGKRPLRTPYRFIADLVDAGVDFDVIGLQFYHPIRDLSDTVRLFEKFETFGKRIWISEAGAPSAETPQGMRLRGQVPTETLQADWAENLFRVAGARASVDALLWYDISDNRNFTPSGGLLSSDGTPKEVFHRLVALKREWEARSSSGSPD
ncbi:MAG TPA: endo-1,4-beta-xylanase [Kofleriaceae bacterium]|nr:endo-1,4-beta-xylanase [Kofleriaceae bacterium]